MTRDDRGPSGSGSVRRGGGPRRRHRGVRVSDCAVETSVDSGSAIDAGDVVLRVDGPAQSVLRGERVAVNVTGHASGVATKTRAAVDAAESVATDSGSRIAGTRETTPGLRGVEKRAVAPAAATPTASRSRGW